MTIVAKASGVTWTAISKLTGIVKASIDDKIGIPVNGGTMYSLTLDNDGGTGFNGYTFAQVYDLAALTLPSDSITRMRVRIQAVTSEGCDIDGMYVGHQAGAGDAYDFAATPVQILFSGSGSVSVGAGSTALSDWASFAYDKTSKLVFAWHISSAADAMKRKLSTSNVTSYFRAATSEAATVNKTAGYTGDATTTYFINLIETDGF
jgi:hypothetical protein